MSSTKLIVILGATGNQGGNVVKSFLAEPGWRIRGITRNTSSTKAKALEFQGVEVVHAHLDDPHSLLTAFRGADAIFAVSDFWGIYGSLVSEGDDSKRPFNKTAADAETQQLRNVIDAAAQITGLERFVVSALSYPSKWSKGKYTHVYHFESKALAVEYGRTTYPSLWEKASIFLAGYFLSNFHLDSIMKPVKDGDGIAQFTSHLRSDTKLPYFAAEEDSGPLVKALIEEPAGKTLIAYREWITPAEFSDAFTKATGVKAAFRTLPLDDVDHYPEGLEEELTENFSYWNEFGYEARDDPTVIHPKNLAHPPQLGTVVEYLTKQDWSKILEG